MGQFHGTAAVDSAATPPIVASAATARLAAALRSVGLWELIGIIVLLDRVGADAGNVKGGRFLHTSTVRGLPGDAERA